MPKGKHRFEWDAGNVSHLWTTHQVRPFEAEEAMKDQHAFQLADEGHSEEERRIAVVGRTRKHRTLFMAFTMRSHHIRVLHGRDAKRKEVATYEEKVRLTEIQKRG